MDNDVKKLIGTNINKGLAKREKQQKELAEYLGIKDNVVSYFCKGTRAPNHEQIIKIARFLNTSTDYLYGFTNVIDNQEPIVKEICDYTGLSEKAVKNLNENSPDGQLSFLFNNGINWETIGIVSVINGFLENEDLSPFNSIYFYRETIRKALDIIKTSIKENNLCDYSHCEYQDAVFHLFRANEDFTEIIKTIVPERKEYEEMRLVYSKLQKDMLKKAEKANGDSVISALDGDNE